MAFRYNHNDHLARSKSFIYGPSKSNIVKSQVVTVTVTYIHFDTFVYIYSALKHGGLSCVGGKPTGGSIFAR